MTVTAETPAEVPAPVVDSKIEGGVGNDVIVPGPPMPSVEAWHAKKLAALRKEGGKKGVEIEGAADMGGLQFFCTSVDLPAGELEPLVESMKAMNAISDPTEEERKGGAGKIGKLLLSCTDASLALVCYVPKQHLEACSATEWLKHVLEQSGAAMPEIVNWDGVDAKSWAGAVLKPDTDKGIFTIKLRDPCITNAYNYLKKRDLFPDGDDDDDEMVFGDDDFDM